MIPYLFIAASDPFECRSAEHFLREAQIISQSGGKVTVMLVQNAALIARRGIYTELVQDLIKHRVELLVDEFAIKTRGIAPADMIEGIKSSSIDTITERMASGHKVLWH